MKVKYNINRTALGSPWGERDWTNAADHLIFDDHQLFDLNLVKKNCTLRGAKSITGFQTSRRGATVTLETLTNGEGVSKKRHNERYITVKRSFK